MTNNIEYIMGEFAREKELLVHPTTKIPLYGDRIETMYSIVQNRHYNNKFTIDERLVACELIREILLEEQKEK